MHPKEPAMSNRFSPPADRARHATAVDVFTSDRGSLPSAANQSLSAPSEADQAAMAAWSIRFDGRAYLFAGYRYNRLADAMNDARRACPEGPCAETSPWSLL
jgi:hypothetical protein